MVTSVYGTIIHVTDKKKNQGKKTYVLKNSNQHQNLMFLLTRGQSCYLSRLK